MVMDLRRGAPVPEPVAAAVVAQLAQALVLCHRRGVAHRDVKPGNVVIVIDAAGEGEEEDGKAEAAPRARLADFGSAAWIGAGGLGRVEGLVGTPHYVASEVVAGEKWGSRDGKVADNVVSNNGRASTVERQRQRRSGR